MAIISTESYHDFELTQIHQAFSAGRAAILGRAASFSNWDRSKSLTLPYDETIWFAGQNTFQQSEIILSGGMTVYNQSIPEMIPNSANYGLAERTRNQNSQSSYVNCAYIGKRQTSSHPNGGLAVWISINAVKNTLYDDVYTYTVTCGCYYQNAIENPTEWSYDVLVGGNYICSENLFDACPQTKIYECTIEEKEYFLFAFGVNGNAWDNHTFFVAFPKTLFNMQIPEPYAGEESKDNSEESYLPETPYTDSISPRDLTGKRNPYGFNSGNGLKLAVIDFQKYGLILQGIYSGTSTGFLNRIAQNLSWIAGGNDHRSAEEIQAMTNAILACHMLPNIVSYTGTSGSIRTISGYQLFGQDLSGVIAGLVMQVTLTSDTIYEFTSGYIRIKPRLNSFLDFEPYTSITLHLPFMNSVQLQPSAVYGNDIKIDYKLDLYSGILSADILIRENNEENGFVREYIICTQQANIKTDIPVIGSGANGNNLSQIASSVIGSATKAGKAAGLAGSIIGGTAAATDALSSISTGVVIGEENLDGIGAYLSSRTAYLIIARPEPAVPSGYFHLQGSTRHGGGKVGDYTGYAEFEAVDLSGFHATEAEKSAIQALLKEGVYL